MNAERALVVKFVSIQSYFTGEVADEIDITSQLVCHESSMMSSSFVLACENSTAHHGQ